MHLVLSTTPVLLASTVCMAISQIIAQSPSHASHDHPEKIIVGWLEKVAIHPGNLVVRAKLDTGAKNSSLHVDALSEFTRNGERWVRFEIENWKGEHVIVERKVHRVAKIKRQRGKAQRRIVIKLGLCMGNLYKDVEVNLADRSRFNYQMLVGRSFLNERLVVDPGSKYTTKPDCKDDEKS